MPKSTPPAPSGPDPIGPYSAVAEANGLVFIAGQVAFDPETNLPIEGDVETQARRIMDNLGAILGDVGLGFSDIVKTTVFLADIGDWPRVNGVYADYFDDAPPARSAIGVGGLPAGFLLEIEAIAAR